MLGADDDLAWWTRFGALLLGGWLGYLALMGLTVGAVLAILLAGARVVAVLRADDLAAFERSHAPWWVAASR